MLNINDGYANHESTPINLKYLKTDHVDKNSDTLETDLLKYVKTLVELQHGIDFENSSFRIVTKRNQIARLDLKNVTSVYMRGRVHRMMIPFEQERYELANVKIIDIPEEFLGEELREWI